MFLQYFRRTRQLLSASWLMLALFEIPLAMAQPFSPELAAAGSSNGVTVFWPLTAYYFALQSGPDLNASSPWTNVATASPNISWRSCFSDGCVPVNAEVIGDQFAVTLGAMNEQEYFRLKSAPPIPVCQFAIFYHGLLEFTATATLIWKGPVHANGPIYTGSSSVLSLSNTVTSVGSISAPTNNGSGYTFPGNVRFSGNPAYITNVPPLVLLGLGTNDPHVLIDMPPDDEDPNTPLGQLRLYNQAHVVLLISNNWVTFQVRQNVNGQVPGADPSPIILRYTNSVSTINTLMFLSLTNVFYDQRESRTNLTTQINVNRYMFWLATNMAVQAKFSHGIAPFPIILYVADNRSTTINQLTVVRLANGAIIPPFRGEGLTVATPNPLYIWGHYNQTNAALLGTTNTASGTVPCALISDALTILSPNWTDSGSRSAAYSYTTNNAAHTTVNAAIITGVVPSTGTGNTQFSGGVHNLVRLLED